MSLQGRRSSILNIEEWLDNCPDEEPDSMLYDPDYPNEVVKMRCQLILQEYEKLCRFVVDAGTEIGLTQDKMDERLDDVHDCTVTFHESIKKSFQEEKDKMCYYKDDKLNQIIKMTNDLHLPPYVPADNLTLTQLCKRLKVRFYELNTIREKRMKRLQELRDKQSKHCLVLGIRAPEVKLQTDIPTEEELTKLAVAVGDLEKEEKRRKDKYDLLKTMIVKCMDQLEYIPEDEFEHLITGDKPSYTESHLLRMTNLHSKLEAQFAINREKFEKLRDRLVSLYDRLDVPQEERDEFLDMHHECKPTIMAEMEIEIERFEELKRQNIGKFIERIKDELAVEYERCYISQEQQEGFFSLSTVSGECNEEILELYERELERIKNFYADNKDILEKFQKWRMMWKELIELEVKANDPGRFNNRGGQLLLEERKRKTLQKGLPKVEKELLALNDKYSDRNDGKKFQIFDTSIDEFVAGCWDELNAAKEEEKRERQRAKNTEPVGSKGRKQQPTMRSQVVVKRTPTKRAAGPGITPTPSKLQCQRSILGTPSQNSYRSNQLLASGSVKKLAQKNIFQPNHLTNSTTKPLNSVNKTLGCKSQIPISGGGRANRNEKTALNSNGSEISALSLSEQEFEDMIVACPASAKRPDRS